MEILSFNVKTERMDQATQNPVDAISDRNSLMRGVFEGGIPLSYYVEVIEKPIDTWFNSEALLNTFRCISRRKANSSMIKHHLLIPGESELINSQLTFERVKVESHTFLSLIVRDEVGFSKNKDGYSVIGFTGVDSNGLGYLFFAETIMRKHGKYAKFLFRIPEEFNRVHTEAETSVVLTVKGVLFEPSQTQKLTLKNSVISNLPVYFKERLALKYPIITACLSYIPWLYQSMGFQEPHMIEVFKYFESQEIASRIAEYLKSAVSVNLEDYSHASFAEERAAFMHVWNMLKGGEV